MPILYSYRGMYGNQASKTSVSEPLSSAGSPKTLVNRFFGGPAYVHLVGFRQEHAQRQVIFKATRRSQFPGGAAVSRMDIRCQLVAL
jgi:hypothetical protein